MIWGFVAALLALMAAPAYAQQSYCPQYGTAAVTHPAAELTYTLNPNDQCKLLVFKNTTAENVTVPPAGAFFPSGWTAHIWAQGSGGLTLSTTPDSGSPTINGATTLTVTTKNSTDLFVDPGLNWWGRTVTGY